MVFLLSPDGYFVDFKPSSETSPLVAPENFLGRHFTEILPKENAKAVTDMIETLRSTGKTQLYNYTLLSEKSKELQYFEARLSLVENYIIVTVRDVTEFKKAENILRTGQIQLESFVLNMPAAIAMFDMNLCYLSWSTRWLQDYGLGDRDLKGLHHYDVFPEIRNMAKWINIHNRCLAGETESCDEDSFLREDGEVEWLRWVVKPWTDLSGKQGGVIMLTEVITARKKAETALVIAKEEAEKASMAKSQFLSNMSHELRTPMNAILGFAQLFEIEGKLTTNQSSQINEIIVAGEHLLNLINEVLDLSKIESGRLDLSIESVDLNELVDECLMLINPLAKEKNIAVHKEIGNIFVHADRIRLKQILINFLSNGVKYNRSGGNLKISAEFKPVNFRYRISIADSGMGIPEDKLTELFKPFNRFVAEDSGIEGTGIGLAICKKLIEHMQGSVGVESKFGQGSVFWFELKKSDIIPEHVFTEKNKNVHVPLISDSNGKIKNVIYIEDNPVNLKLVSGLFKQRPSYILTSCNDPLKGQELIFKNKPDLILVDILMPEMNGFQILESVRANEQTKNIPVIAITANAMKTDVLLGLQAGFNEYLAKPLDIGNFYKILDSYLKEN